MDCFLWGRGKWRAGSRYCKATASLVETVKLEGLPHPISLLILSHFSHPSADGLAPFIHHYRGEDKLSGVKSTDQN